MAKSLGLGGKDNPLNFAGRALQHYHNTCYKGEHIERVDISQYVYEIAISAVQDERCDRIYVTGMEFIYEDDRPPVFMGYTTPGAEESHENDFTPPSEGYQFSASQTLLKVHCHENLSLRYRYPGVRLILGAKLLKGFHVGRSPHGIHMVGLIRDSGCSHYVGSPNYICRDGHQLDDENFSHESMLLLEIKEVIATVDVSPSLISVRSSC